ncbi:response regulator [Candidatus Parabeggiatoa sp. HSG14]|uniref:response regulator n=1 Tax=Candidatus Parabeggiatoa sp. HSG14 TaxID=3055593 RepID=UPI0025A85B13|nr:response regulator [Thiotrichales bacterium HSG14]
MQLNIRKKLLLAFGLILLLSTAVNIYSLIQMDVLAGLTTKLFNHPLQVTRAVLSADSGIVKMHRSMKDVALATNVLDMDAAHAHVNQYEQEVLAQFAIVQKWILGKEGANLIQETIQIFQAWIPIRHEVIALMTAEQRDKASAITKGKGAKHVALLNSKMSALTHYAAQKANDMYDNAQMTRSQVITTTIIALITIIILVGLFAFFISFGIVKSVQMINMLSQQMINGEIASAVTNQEKFAHALNSKDEMAEIGRAFYAVANSFKTVIDDIVQVSQGLAKGNLRITPKTTYQGDFIQIKNALNTTLSNQRQVVEDIIKVSQGLAAGDLRIIPKAEYQGDFVQIKDALTTTSSDLGKVIEDIVQVSQGLVECRHITAKASYRGDFVKIKNALEIAATQLAEMSNKSKVQDWLKTGQARLNEQITGEQEIATVTKKIISFLTTYVDAQVGLFYNLQEMEDQTYLQLVASYAYIENDSLPNKYSLNEGLVGQAAMERKIISVTQTPEECPAIVRSSLSAASPQYILLLPFLYEGTVKGVIEIGSANLMTEIQQSFLEQVMPNVGIVVNMAESRTQMQTLLKQSQQLTEKLKIKQDDLQQNNVKLQEQAEELQQQSEELETQQEELRQTNEALEIRAKDFERQQIDFQNKISTLEQTKREVEKAKAAVESKTQELALATHQQPDVIAPISIQPIDEITSIPTQPQEKITPIFDDRNALQPGDTSLLVIEDDRKFSSIILELSHKKGFKCIIAEDGFSGLEMAEKYEPNAIILDIGLPKLDGLSVMERLKDNPKLRHIPVHFMSAADEEIDAKKLGAIGYLIKPVALEQLDEALKDIEQFWNKTVKHLLIITDNESHQKNIMQMVAAENVQVKVATGNACQQIQIADYDCIILDMDIDSAKQLLTKMLEIDSCKASVIVYTERNLSTEEETLLLQYANEFSIKLAHSLERLLDEVTLFLHQAEQDLPTAKRDMLHKVRDNKNILKNKKVLIIDDDIRNSHTLASILENYGVEIIFSDKGEEGLKQLTKHDDVDVVLINIIMQGMDGYETIQAIRKQPKYRQLPIIAITAKTERGEKAKCIEAGANDYLPKPIDSEKLLSVMRVWLYR